MSKIDEWNLMLLLLLLNVAVIHDSLMMQ